MFPSTPKINPATSVDISWLLRSGLWSAASAMWQQLLIFTPCSRVHTDPILLCLYCESGFVCPNNRICIIKLCIFRDFPTLPITLCQRDECQRCRKTRGSDKWMAAAEILYKTWRWLVAVGWWLVVCWWRDAKNAEPIVTNDVWDECADCSWGDSAYCSTADIHCLQWSQPCSYQL